MVWLRRFFGAKGEEVVVTDTNIKAQSESEDALKNYDIRYIWGKQPDIDELNLDLIVVSPGVPLSIAPIVRAKELGIPVTGEVELAYLNAKAPIVAITALTAKLPLPLWSVRFLKLPAENAE